MLFSATSLFKSDKIIRRNSPVRISGWDGWRAPWAASSAARFLSPADPQVCAADQFPAATPGQEESANQHLAYRKQDVLKSGLTYTLRCREGDVTQLLEEEDARHGGDQVHDQVVVHHAPGVQLQAFEVVWREVGRQLGAAESWWRFRQIRRGDQEQKPEILLFIFKNILQAASSFSFLFCRMLSAKLGWKLLNW